MNTKKAEFEKDKGSKIMFYMYTCINIYRKNVTYIL